MEGGIANGLNWFPSHASILEWVLTPKFIYNLLSFNAKTPCHWCTQVPPMQRFCPVSCRTRNQVQVPSDFLAKAHPKEHPGAEKAWRISVRFNLTFNIMLGNIQTLPSTHVMYLRLLRLCMISLPLTVGRCHRRDVPVCKLNIVMVKPHRHPSFVRLKVENPWNPRLFLHHSYTSLCVYLPCFIMYHL